MRLLATSGYWGDMHPLSFDHGTHGAAKTEKKARPRIPRHHEEVLAETAKIGQAFSSF